MQGNERNFKMNMDMYTNLEKMTTKWGKPKLLILLKFVAIAALKQCSELLPTRAAWAGALG